MTVVTSSDADFTQGIDPILKSICKKLQLTATQHELAEGHYKAVGDWLEKDGSILAQYRPRIYPQGSLPMGITNKPLESEEYDLDFICELQINWQETTPADLFSKIEFRISQHKDYKERMELGKRCIRLTYAHDFHLDIVPACANATAGEGQVRIPDRELQNWKDTNSKQYVWWFNAIADRPQYYSNYRRDTEPLPNQEPFDGKSSLKFAVQLMKRHRDVAFRAKPDLAPASIVLSTLAAEYYSGKPSVFVTVREVLQGIQSRILRSPGGLQVWNPANRVAEDLGERWEKNPSTYEAFKQWIWEFAKTWQRLEQTRGLKDISDILVVLFDEHPTREAIYEDAKRLGQDRQSGLLGVTAGSGLLTTESAAIAVPRNTFYGQ
jgi:hypothetical protein